MIPIEQIITSTKLMLEIGQTAQYDAELRLYINQGASQLYATNSLTLMCKTVPVDCYKAEIEQDFLFFAFPDSSNVSCSCGTETCSCPTFYSFATPKDFAVYKKAGCTFGSAAGMFTYSGGYLYLPSTVTATEITYYYYGLATDEEGYVVLYPDYEIALSHYAAYRFVSTANKINKYSPEFRKITWQTWLAQFNRLTSEKFARQVRNSKDEIRSVMARSLTYHKFPQVQGMQ